MNERYLVGYFESGEAMEQATAEARRRGYAVVDAFSPYVTHDLSPALGLGPSRLVWIGFWAGVIGLAVGLTIQFWTSAYDWPLIVGGQPFNAWPVFIPVSFELTVLFAGIIGVLALLARAKLWPGNRPPAVRQVTDNRFALVLAQPNAAVETEEMVELLQRYGAAEIVEGDQVE